jgi:hypothetical protein
VQIPLSPLSEPVKIHTNESVLIEIILNKSSFRQRLSHCSAIHLIHSDQSCISCIRKSHFRRIHINSSDIAFAGTGNATKTSPRSPAASHSNQDSRLWMAGKSFHKDKSPGLLSSFTIRSQQAHRAHECNPAQNQKHLAGEGGDGWIARETRHGHHSIQEICYSVNWRNTSLTLEFLNNLRSHQMSSDQQLRRFVAFDASANGDLTGV